MKKIFTKASKQSKMNSPENKRRLLLLVIDVTRSTQHSTIPRSNNNYCEPLRLRLLEADLDFISLSPDPSLSDPLDRDLDLERSLSSLLKFSFQFI